MGAWRARVIVFIWFVQAAATYAWMGVMHRRGLAAAIATGHATWAWSVVLALDLACFVSATAFLARRRRGMNGLIAVSLAALPFDAVLRAWPLVMVRATTVSMAVLLLHAANISRDMLRRGRGRAGEGFAARFGPTTGDPLATALIAARGVGYFCTGVLFTVLGNGIALNRSIMRGVWFLVLLIAIVWPSVYVPMHFHLPDFVGMLVGIGVVAVGAGVMAGVERLFGGMPDLYGSVYATARQMPREFLAFGHAALRPRMFAEHNRKTDELLATKTGFSLLLRSWREASGALAYSEVGQSFVPLIAEGVARAFPLVTIADPRHAWPPRVLTPLASYFWWAENVRTLIHHARSIVVIANQLTAGLVSEMEEVLEQGRGGQTLVLALPSRDPKSSPFASEAPNGALAAYVEARFPNRCVLSSSDASRTFWLQALARWAGEPTAENASLVGAALEYGRAHPDSEVTSALAGSERRFELEIKDRVAASDFNSWLRSRRR